MEDGAFLLLNLDIFAILVNNYTLVAIAFNFRKNINGSFKIKKGNDVMQKGVISKKEKTCIGTKKFEKRLFELSQDKNHLIRSYSEFFLRIFGSYVTFPIVSMPNERKYRDWFPVCVPPIRFIRNVAYAGDKNNVLMFDLFNLREDFRGKIENLGRAELANRPYIILTPIRVEAGGEFERASFADVIGRERNVLTAWEMWILNLFVYWHFGSYIDRHSITLAGSCDLSGNVFGFGYDGSAVTIDTYNPALRAEKFYFREAVSL